jgi:curved DNA-binding protein
MAGSPGSDSAEDFYSILGVARTATAEEIQRAYRKLARRWHPDVNRAPDASERFKQIAEAYQVLSDPEQRRRYDAFGPDFRQVPEGVDPAAWARTAGARSRTAGGDAWVWTDAGSPGGYAAADAISLEELLSHLGGLGSAAGRSHAHTGADQEATLELSLEEAYAGGSRTITLGAPGGSRSLTVTIPPGVTDGQRLRLAGQGLPGAARSGDLYLVIRIRPDARYQVQGRDVTTAVRVSPWEAALGARVDVDTLSGKLSVTIPAGTSSGTKLRLRGKGLPNPKGKPGDLYLDVRIVVPPKLSAEERRLFEQLAKTSRFDPRRSV